MWSTLSHLQLWPLFPLVLVLGSYSEAHETGGEEGQMDGCLGGQEGHGLICGLMDRE